MSKDLTATLIMAALIGLLAFAWHFDWYGWVQKRRRRKENTDDK